MPIGNPDDVFTDGDLMQCVEPCDPPQPLADLPDDLKEAILAQINKGLPDGRRYSNHHSAKPDRQAWKIVNKITDRDEDRARATINAWVKDELLRCDSTIRTPGSRERGGLFVNWDIWNDRKSG